MPKHRFGCSSVIAAVNLQFELASYGLFTDVLHDGKRWVCDHNESHVVKHTVTTRFRSQWMQQAPSGLSQGTIPV